MFCLCLFLHPPCLQLQMQLASLIAEVQISEKTKTLSHVDANMHSRSCSWKRSLPFRTSHTPCSLVDLADMLVRKWLCSLCGCLLLYPWQQYPPKNETAVPVAAMNAVRATFFTFNSSKVYMYFYIYIYLFVVVRCFFLNDSILVKTNIKSVIKIF